MPAAATVPSTVVATREPSLLRPAFETGIYPNLFADYLGKSDEEIQTKIDETWN